MLGKEWMKQFFLLWELLYSWKDVPTGYIVVLGNGGVLSKEGTERPQANQCYGEVCSGRKRANILLGQDGKLKFVAFKGTWEVLRRAYKLACSKEWRRIFCWKAVYIPQKAKT